MATNVLITNFSISEISSMDYNKYKFGKGSMELDKKFSL